MTEHMSFRVEDQICDFSERVGDFIVSEIDREEERDVGAVEQKRLREILHSFSSALRNDSLRPEHFSTLVGFVLENFKKTNRAEDLCVAVALEENDGSELDCPACHRFMWEPVTVPCGHTFCRGCVLQTSFTRCIICREETGPNLRTNVILCGLLEKWCPVEVQMWRRVSEAEGLLKSGQFDEAVALTSRLLDRDPGNVRLRACRAEAYRGLLQYRHALDDWEMCGSTALSLEVVFCKAKLLKEMGRVDESLKLFLQCLSVDEDFKQARQEVENILPDLLWPVCESVQASLNENPQNPLAHLHQKAAGMPTDKDISPTRLPPEEAEQTDSLERSGLIRAQSLRSHVVSRAGGEGLKRVSSAPQLGALLKRKLSGQEMGVGMVKSNDPKHKRAGGDAEPAASAQEDKIHYTVPRDKLDSSDFECSLCMRLFYEPVTTPCGHSFCKNCLQRCLDHSPHCPLCKESLKLYLASRKYFITHVIDDLIKRYLEEEYAGRQKIHNDETKELSDLENNVPIFVCTMAYPTVPCPLHVFEPRYRLMIRRCIDTGTRQFGMCINDAKKGFADVGCMLHIRNVHFLPDGRSVVDTVGGKRFRVLTRSIRDGYSIANIEYLQDQKVEGEQEQELQDLYDQVYNQASVWFHTLENRFRNQILQHFGPMPEKENDIQSSPNGPACCWWLLAVLPVDPRYQLSLLSMITLKERLIKIQHILTYLQNSHPTE